MGEPMGRLDCAEHESVWLSAYGGHGRPLMDCRRSLVPPSFPRRHQSELHRRLTPKQSSALRLDNFSAAASPSVMRKSTDSVFPRSDSLGAKAAFVMTLGKRGSSSSQWESSATTAASEKQHDGKQSGDDLPDDWAPLVGGSFAARLSSEATAVRLAQQKRKHPDFGMGIMVRALATRPASALLLVGIVDLAYACSLQDEEDFYAEQLRHVLPGQAEIAALCSADPLVIREARQWHSLSHLPISERSGTPSSREFRAIPSDFFLSPILLVQALAVAGRHAARHFELSAAENFYMACLRLGSYQPGTKVAEGYRPQGFVKIPDDLLGELRRALALVALETGNSSLWRQCALEYKPTEVGDYEAAFLFGRALLREARGQQDVVVATTLLEGALRHAEASPDQKMVGGMTLTTLPFSATLSRIQVPVNITEIAETLLMAAEKSSELMAQWRALRLLCAQNLHAPDLRLKLGQVYEKLNMQLKAKQFYARAIKLGAGPSGNYALAALHTKRREFDKAIEHFEKLEGSGFDGGLEGRRLMAEALQFTVRPNYAKALVAWQKVLELEPEDISALNHAGNLCYNHLNELRAAESLMRRLRRALEKGDPTAQDAAKLRDEALLVTAEISLLYGEVEASTRIADTEMSVAARQEPRAQLLKAACLRHQGKVKETLVFLVGLRFSEADWESKRLCLLAECQLRSGSAAMAKDTAASAMAAAPTQPLPRLLAAWAAAVSEAPVTLAAEHSAAAVAFATTETALFTRVMDAYCALLVRQEQHQAQPNKGEAAYETEIATLKSLFLTCSDQITTLWSGEPKKGRFWVTRDWADASLAYAIAADLELASVRKSFSPTSSGELILRLKAAMPSVAAAVSETEVRLRRTGLTPSLQAWSSDALKNALGQLPLLHRWHISRVADAILQFVLRNTKQDEFTARMESPAVREGASCEELPRRKSLELNGGRSQRNRRFDAFRPGEKAGVRYRRRPVLPDAPSSFQVDYVDAAKIQVVDSPTLSTPRPLLTLPLQSPLSVAQQTIQPPPPPLVHHQSTPYSVLTPPTPIAPPAQPQMMLNPPEASPKFSLSAFRVSAGISRAKSLWPRKPLLSIPAEKLLPPGSVRKGARLGSGGFGSVYRGTLTSTGREIAIKQLHLDLTLLTSEQWNDILAEIQAAWVLQHPALVEFVGILVEPHALSIVCELCVNGSLYAALHGSKGNRHQLPTSFTVRQCVARQLFDALAFLHSRTPKVVHRDIKSLNVVLDANWNAKLCDFGLTTSMDGLKSHISLKAGAVGGSPRYMAPECFDSDARIDEKVDIWGAGCLLIEIFGGPLPFYDCTDIQHIMKRLLVDKRGPEIPEHFPPDLIRIIKGCLHFDSHQRWDSTRALKKLHSIPYFTIKASRRC